MTVRKDSQPVKQLKQNPSVFFRRKKTKKPSVMRGPNRMTECVHAGFYQYYESCV